MITSLNVFKKLYESSLSTDRKTDFKLKYLIQTAKELVDAKLKLEIATAIRKTKNAELVELLKEMETHSIICNGVLLEFIDDYESSSVDFKGYEQFLADSIDVIGDQYKEMHDKIAQITTQMSGGKEYIRINKNTKNNPEGIIEGFGDAVNNLKTWILRIKRSVMAFLNRSSQQINDIKNTYQSLKNNVAYESKINENTFRSKYQNLIVQHLTNGDLSYLDLLAACGFKPGTSQDYGLYLNIQKLRSLNVIKYVKNGRKFIYSLTNTTTPVATANLVDVPATVSKPVSNEAIVEALAKASEIISVTEEEKFYEELVEVKKQQVIDLLKEFNAKKLAIDDKIAMLITEAPKLTLNKAEYMDKMTNAAEVGDAVSEMAQNLFSLYTKAHSVTGSLRQFKDDSNSANGTLGATFDYVFKTVSLPEANESESFITRLTNRIKRFFSNFKIASKRADMALNQI